ncbi:MAG: oligosaccharide flippase family protein [Polyangiales bacterium]
MGARPAIIQNERDPAFLSTIWTIQVMRGFCLWMVACAIAIPWASYNDRPVLASLVPAAGLVALIDSFISTNLFSQNRSLDVKRIIISKSLRNLSVWQSDCLGDSFAFGLGFFVLVRFRWQRCSSLQSLWLRGSATVSF